MAEKKQETFRTTIGGQALIEGILMRGPEKDAIVVRAPEGLVTKVTERKFIKDRYPILGIPILRGAVTFISSMITGVKALMFSADYFPDDEDAKPGKFDQWLEKHIPAEKLQSLIVAFSVILSLGLTLVLFMLLPTFIAGLFHAQSAAVHNIIEGVVKVAVFLLVTSPSGERTTMASFSGNGKRTVKNRTTVAFFGELWYACLRKDHSGIWKRSRAPSALPSADRH